jgi:2,5-furandicarboxylate decarboxylase 1
MGFREFVGELEKKGDLIVISREVDPKYEIAALLKQAEGKGVKFTKVKGHRMHVVGGIGSSRELIAKSLGIDQKDLIFRIADAIENPKKPKVIKNPSCQDVVLKGSDVDIWKLPILTHYEKDGGPYMSSSIIVVNNEKWGRNIATHRILAYGPKNKLVTRLCERDTLQYLTDAGGEIDAAIVIGVHPAVQIASATRVKIDVDEMGIANALKETSTAKCLTKDIEVPADAEIVLEGRLSAKERVKEGPFVDITGTYDFPERKEPVFTVETITMRKDAIYHALLPGMVEHKLYMGMPREPTIYKEVKKVCDCLNVALTPGGCGWLHGVVQIRKKSTEDGKNAIRAAYKGHASMKHVVVVDEDINIFDKDEVEWAIATRFQAGKDAIIEEAAGSSVDSSSDAIPGTDRRKTTRVGIDATIPHDKDKRDFLRPRIPGEDKIKLSNYTK